MVRDQEQISPAGIILTVLLHLLLIYGASTRFGHHHRVEHTDTIVAISIPAAAPAHPEAPPDIESLLTAPEQLIAASEASVPLDAQRYYLPTELSQQVQVLQDLTPMLNIPIRERVTMSLYINEAGTVDDISIDEAGDSSPAEQQRLLQAFRQILFFPGMRGEKVVKALIRIELEINRKVIINRG